MTAILYNTYTPSMQVGNEDKGGEVAATPLFPQFRTVDKTPEWDEGDPDDLDGGHIDAPAGEGYGDDD